MRKWLSACSVKEEYEEALLGAIPHVEGTAMQDRFGGVKMLADDAGPGSRNWWKRFRRARLGGFYLFLQQPEAMCEA